MKLSQLSLADYNKLDSIPVINQDLSASGFTPVANTYYRHTGATTDTFTQGVIYLYDTEYKALDGSGGGGISDVQVNGASVVTDGVANIVANIPEASISTAGVVTKGGQDFQGDKRIYGSITFLNGNSASESQQSYARQYDVVFGCERYGGEVYFSKGSYDSPALVIKGGNGYDYLYIKPQRKKPPYIEYINSSSNRGRIDFPEHSGTAMLAPSTWSSGTGGSLTLTESGTYQFYTGTAAKINYTLLYVELGKESIAYAGKNVQLEIDTNNVVHVFDMSQAEPVEKTVTLKYRRIGI